MRIRNLNPKKLAEYLEVLRGAGVAEFEQDGFRVRFAPQPGPEQLGELEVDESELTEEDRRKKREDEKREQFVSETWSAD